MSEALPAKSKTPGMLSFARPTVGQEEVEAVRRVLDSRWLTQGPEVECFEREFAACFGARYACAVSSCTAALHMALTVLDVGPGDEVITVSHSFIATANAIRYCNAVPVFVDIEPETLNIDPGRIERAITPRTAAILCVHQLGMPADLESVIGLARRHDLKVVEDAACAAGSEIFWRGRWEKIGRPHGDIACFSFHPRKLMTTGDGGMLTTNVADFAERLHHLRQHGMSVPSDQRHRSGRVIFEDYVELGFNYRMTDIQAAIGRIQVGRLPEIVARHRQSAHVYRELLDRQLPDLGLPMEPTWARSNYQSFCVRLPSGCDQREVMQQLLDRGIPTRRGVMCAHREQAYHNQDWRCPGPKPDCLCAEGACASLPASEAAQDRSILLPMHAELERQDQTRIVQTLAAIL